MIPAVVRRCEVLLFCMEPVKQDATDVVCPTTTGTAVAWRSISPSFGRDELSNPIRNSRAPTRRAIHVDAMSTTNAPTTSHHASASRSVLARNMMSGPAENGNHVITRATTPCGSRSSTAIIIIGSAAVSDHTIASCCASRMFDPSDPVPSMRLPKNRKRDEEQRNREREGDPRHLDLRRHQQRHDANPADDEDEDPDRNLKKTRGAETEQLAGEDLVGIRRCEQDLDDLVFFFGAGALHQIAGCHQYRHQKEDGKDERYGDADEASGLAAVSDLTGLGHAEASRIPERREDACAGIDVNAYRSAAACERGWRTSRAP